jgi:hypothetical protein
MYDDSGSFSNMRAGLKGQVKLEGESFAAGSYVIGTIRLGENFIHGISLKSVSVRLISNVGEETINWNPVPVVVPPNFTTEGFPFVLPVDVSVVPTTVQRIGDITLKVSHELEVIVVPNNEENTTYELSIPVIIFDRFEPPAIDETERKIVSRGCVLGRKNESVLRVRMDSMRLRRGTCVELEITACSNFEIFRKVVARIIVATGPRNMAKQSLTFEAIEGMVDANGHARLALKVPDIQWRTFNATNLVSFAAIQVDAVRADGTIIVSCSPFIDIV